MTVLLLAQQLANINNELQRALTSVDETRLSHIAERQEALVTQLFSSIDPHQLTNEINVLLQQTIALNEKTVDVITKQKQTILQQQVDLKRHVHANHHYTQTEQL